MNKKQKNEKIFLIMFVLGIGLIGGFVVGMMIQQMIFIAGAIEIAEGLEGTTFNIEVDINETELIKGFKEILVPIFNQTFQENKKEGVIK